MIPSNAIDGRLRGPFTGLALPGGLLVLLLGTIGWQTGVLQVPRLATGTVAGPQTTMVEPRAFAYRVAGAYQLDDGTIIDAPIVDVARPQPLEIMTHQVTVGEYSRCVAAGGCAAPQGRQIADTYPVTGVSFDDASDYASWLSAATDADWRLPSVEEWVFAAAEKAVDPALGLADDSDNPADRWLAVYARESSLGPADGPLGPVGGGGTNSLGIADLAGPVWEWTATCDGRTTLDGSGQIVSRIESCGVRLLEGQHRTPMSGFIKDARTGGCSTGRPPDALGLRLVKVPSMIDGALAWFGALMGVTG
jgi:formylglycine-generating enzyme required for sulfatase activity